MAEHASCSDVCLHDVDCLQGYSIVADLMNVSDAKRTVDEAVQKMGGLDVLVGWPPQLYFFSLRGMPFRV